MIGGHDHGSRCVKMEKYKIGKSNDKSGDIAEGMDMNACKMTCGKFGALWPRPTGYVNLSETLFEVFPDNIALEMQSANTENQGIEYIISVLRFYRMILCFKRNVSKFFIFNRINRQLILTTKRGLSSISLSNASIT